MKKLFMKIVSLLVILVVGTFALTSCSNEKGVVTDEDIFFIDENFQVHYLNEFDIFKGDIKAKLTKDDVKSIDGFYIMSQAGLNYEEYYYIVDSEAWDYDEKSISKCSEYSSKIKYMLEVSKTGASRKPLYVKKDLID